MGEMLSVKNINVYYGSIHAIKDVSFHVNEGEIVTLIGANGAGKTTTMHAISGLLKLQSGEIDYCGQTISKMEAHKIIRLGLAQVPEGRRVFSGLTVQQNLQMGAYTRRDGKEAIQNDFDMVFDLLPRLKERRNGVYYPGHHYDLNNTTPESYELQKILRQLADAGCDACVMEVSSQGIMMDRVAGIHYKVGVFTNLYPDHIGPGEHSSFEEYRSWKGKLFQRCDVGVVNADDPNTEALLEGHTCKLVTYGIHAPKVDYRASEQYRLLRNKEMLGVEFTLTEPDGHTLDVQVGMPGLFSIYNALATIGVGKVLGLADAPIHEGLKKALVKGRVELVPISHKFTILIDYAHNEAATESLIETLREYNPNRLVVVFGCGGNRSKLRRYGMGEVCAKLADFSILTEDNNRFEKVEDIIADIKTGMAKGNPDAKYVEIPDRLDALHYAIDHAQEGDLIAVIGKGHEAYRDREGVKTPFLERELIEEYAAETGVE